MQTLSRMTGKDFSGPVPIIRAKTAPNLEPANSEAMAAAKKQSKTPGPTEAAPKEAGADVETVQTSSTRPGSKAAPNTASQKKKSVNEPSRDDVEVLGTIDGDWD
jgi:transcription factor TFIIIB component B''